MNKVKFLSLTILVLLFSSFSVQAEEEFECYLPEEVLDSPFVLEGSDAVTIESSEITDHVRFNHTIKFKDEMVVSYSAGGCVHHRQSFSFSGVPFSLGEAFDDAGFQKIMNLFKGLPFKEDDAEYFLRNLEYSYTNRNNSDALLCDDCSEGQIAVHDENGMTIVLSIDDVHAFSLHTDFPL